MDFFIRKEALSWLYFILTYGCILSFFHSSLFVFRTSKESGHKTKLLLKVPTLILWNSVPFHFFFVEKILQMSLLPIAMGMSLISLAVYWYSVYAISEQRFSVIHESVELNTIYQKKIYAFVRHPFYCSYILCYLGVLMAMPNLIHFTAVGVIIIIYMRAAKKEQDNFLRSSLAREYKNYMNTTGMFFPCFKKNIVASKKIM